MSSGTAGVRQGRIRPWLGAWLIAAVGAASIEALPAYAGPASAPAANAAARTWKINLKNAEIRELVTQVAAITGKTFVIDPRVKGKVTVISSESLNEHGVYELFLSVLRVHGFAAIPAGDVIKIQQQNYVKQSGSGPDRPGQIEDFVTRVIAAENVDSNELVKILRPLVPQYGHLAPITTPNVVIISDHAENIDRLMDLVRTIDVAQSDAVEVIVLKEAWVANLAALLEQLMPEQVGRAAKGPNRVQVIADERTNALLLRGKPGPIRDVRQLITQLDRPATVTGSTEVIYLAHADAKDIADILKGLTTGSGASTATLGAVGGAEGAAAAAPRAPSNIQADVSLNAIVVKGDPGQIAELKDLISKLDVRRTQVLIEAAIVEVTMSDRDAVGVDFAAIDASGKSVPLVSTALSSSLATLLAGLTTDAADGGVDVIGGITAVQTTGQPTIAVAKINLNGVSFGAIIQAFASNANANLLSTPSILTLDNEEAKITVGQSVPFRTGSFTTDNSGANNPFTTIQREDVGVTLKVIPHIHDGSVVRLEVEQEVSSVTNSAALGAADIVTNKRTINTTILADDRQTIVLGGLIRDDINEVIKKVPFLGDIPLLGALFRNKDLQRNKQNLLVFLKPTVLRDTSDARELTQRKYDEIPKDGKGVVRPQEVDALFNTPQAPE